MSLASIGAEAKLYPRVGQKEVIQDHGEAIRLLAGRHAGNPNPQAAGASRRENAPP